MIARFELHINGEYITESRKTVFTDYADVVKIASDFKKLHISPVSKNNV